MPIGLWGSVVPTWTMNWTAGEGAASYNIYWRRSSEPTYGNLVNTGGSGLTYPITFTLAGVTYIMRVTAVDADGFEGAPGPESTFLNGNLIA